MLNSEELRGYLVPFRFNKAPHIVIISVFGRFFGGYNREERANFVRSTLLILEVEVDTVWKNHLLDGLFCLQI